MNPLYKMMMGNMMPNNNMTNMINQFQQFRQAFTGDPRQQVQQLLNSGKISQEQYNNAVQMANQLRQFIK